MKKYICYSIIIFFIIFSPSGIAAKNQPENQPKTPAIIKKGQWRKVPVYGASKQEVWKALNKVMTKYFFTMLRGKDGAAWEERGKKGSSATEWIQLEPDTLIIIAKITKNPVRLFLSIGTEIYKNKKWISHPLTIEDKNMLSDIMEQIQFKILEK
ncbi:MAG: hypothetical protein M1135_01130 [Candidatus Omnitrophica bacterium]|nr:hypothetical protein [Candidatus Omnitrophota bacterium]